MQWITLWFALCVGASVGATMRWLLSMWLNPGFASGAHPLFWGTIAANLLGAYLIGVLWAWVTSHEGFSPALQLCLITGMLGALTTYSTFSLEIVYFLTHGKLGQALLSFSINALGSITLTYLGLQSYPFLASFLASK